MLSSFLVPKKVELYPLLLTFSLDLDPFTYYADLFDDFFWAECPRNLELGLDLEPNVASLLGFLVELVNDFMGDLVFIVYSAFKTKR